MGCPGAGHDRANRHARTQPFGQWHHIRFNARPLVGKPLAGSAHATLNLVNHQQPVPLIAQCTHLFEVIHVHGVHAPLALNGLEKHGDHIRVTLVMQRLPAKAQNVLEYWCLLAASALSVYLAWFACRLVWVSYITHDVSPSADVSPLWIPQLTMALGCIGFAIAFLHALYARMTGGLFFDAPVEGELARTE